MISRAENAMIEFVSDITVFRAIVFPASRLP
jgi:hypothetical protein